MNLAKLVVGCLFADCTRYCGVTCTQRQASYRPRICPSEPIPAYDAGSAKWLALLLGPYTCCLSVSQSLPLQCLRPDVPGQLAGNLQRCKSATPLC